MIKTRHEEVWTEVIETIECDKCHKVFPEEDAETAQDSFEVHEFHHIKFTGGYGNKTFGDLTTIECDICQYCLHDMIRDFARISDSNFDLLEALGSRPLQNLTKK